MDENSLPYSEELWILGWIFGMRVRAVVEKCTGIITEISDDR